MWSGVLPSTPHWFNMEAGRSRACTTCRTSRVDPMEPRSAGRYSPLRRPGARRRPPQASVASRLARRHTTYIQLPPQAVSGVRCLWRCGLRDPSLFSSKRMISTFQLLRAIHMQGGRPTPQVWAFWLGCTIIPVGACLPLE